MDLPVIAVVLQLGDRTDSKQGKVGCQVDAQSSVQSPHSPAAIPWCLGLLRFTLLLFTVVLPCTSPAGCSSFFLDDLPHTIYHTRIWSLSGLNDCLIPLSRDLGLNLDLKTLSDSFNWQADQKIQGIQTQFRKRVEDRRILCRDVENAVDDQRDQVGDQWREGMVEDGGCQVDASPESCEAFL